MLDIICGHFIFIKSEELVSIFFKICKNPVQNKHTAYKYFGSILLITEKVAKTQVFSLLQRLFGIKMNKRRAKSKG